MINQTIFFLISFIKENPGFIAWMISGLTTLTVLLLGVYYTLVYRDVGSLKRRVAILESHMTASTESLKGLTIRMEEHMHEEEVRVWSAVDKISDDLTVIRADHGERLARIEAQVGAISPVGCMSEVLMILRDMKQEGKKTG